MNNKGLSPLMTTFILLVISVIIGVLVMSWGKSYVQQATSVSDVVTTQQASSSSIFSDLNARLEQKEITQQQYDQIKSILLAQNNS